MAGSRRPNYKILFDMSVIDDESTRTPLQPTISSAPTQSRDLSPPEARETTPSLNFFNSYPSQPGSTPPTSKAEWTQVQNDRASRQQASSHTRSSRTVKTPVPNNKNADSSNEELNAHLNERINKMPNTYPRPEPSVPNRPQIVRQFHSNIVDKYVQYLLEKRETGTWLDCPELPTTKELLDENEPWTKLVTSAEGEQVVIDGNCLQGAWPSTETYLSAHYGMLREEAVQPLRQAIAWVKAFPQSPEDMSPGGEVGIYTKVHITTFTFSPRGLGIRVVFSLSKVGKKVRWEQSKRLIAGTLVALTPTKDMFRTTCIVAVVAARPMDLIQEEPPKLDLFFAKSEDIDIDPSIEYTMVEERTSFFEAVRHTMLSLQKMASEKFPLSKHIVGVDDLVPPPRYIADRPELNLSAVYDSDIEARYVNINVLNGWPSGAKTTLDASQEKALQHVFRRRLAVIQGPPGTGKTHVSVMALKVLVENMAPTDPPIVVSCQTNHALDQLLRHIAKFEDRFIRLGGRSKDQGVVKEHTLYNVRQKVRFKAPGGMQASARNSLRNLEDEMRDLLAPLEYGKDHTSTGFMSLDTYRKAGILTEKQCKTLERGDDEWAGAPSNIKSPIAQWLGNCLQHNKRSFKPDDLGFDFEEVDLEFEQLKELEAENVCQDDDNDFESLPGNALSLFLAIVGKHSNVGEEKIETWLQNDNLWKIPTRHRGAVFNHIQRKAIQVKNERVRQLTAIYNRHAIRHRYGGFENNAILLRQQRIIGVTTTGLSKYRALLSAACPRVVMIEEAAETMEPPVTAGCVPSVEHLILVGDHKQLRPQCGVKSLETEPFNLNVSMFERIVDNNLPYKMLKRQRRMIPEVRRLLDPIYKNDIKDHISMRNPEVRPPVSGMGGVNSFFYTHAWADSVDEQLSSTNVQEADMVVEFYDYLINNGLTESEITILTFYNGQRKLLLRKLRNHHRLSRMGTEQNRIFKVLTVDSYQGEENEVVLLSLVKSNDQGRIGFIGVENRICVALSRAKRGFYMFGNAELLVGESKLWAKVINILLADTSVIKEDRHPASEPHGRVVFRIPLRCSNHNVRTYIEQIEDWDKIDGGCQKMCSHSLACGHFCDLNCHPFSHDKTVCLEQCKKVLQCGHRCIQQCYDQCRCSICGTKEPRTLTNGNGDIAGVADSGGDTSSQGSNVRAWNAFASGDRVQHDAMLHEMQRERYLQDQMKTVSSEAVKNVAADTKVLPPRQAALPEAQIDAMALDPKALVPSDAASPVAVDGITAPMSPSANAPAPRKVKVSHKDRFKRTAPATALISTHAASPTKATPPPTLFTPPPVGYTGASSLYPALQPLRMVQNQPATPQSTTFGTVRVAPPPEMNGEEDLLIDLAEY